MGVHGRVARVTGVVAGTLRAGTWQYMGGLDRGQLAHVMPCTMWHMRGCLAWRARKDMTEWSGQQERHSTVARAAACVVLLQGLGVFPTDDPQCLQMLGMHGTVFANYAVDQADLLIALGVRFDDRVTGKLEAFAQRAKIVHIDIDAAEIGKNKVATIPVCADIKPSLRILNKLIDDAAAQQLQAQYQPWRAEVDAKRAQFPMRFPDRDDMIVPQYAVQMLGEETRGRDVVITTGVGQHQMFAAQWFPYREPRMWVTSGGLGSMGFGLPSALGAAAAFDGKNGRPKKTVVDIDGDGSFLMNVQVWGAAQLAG